MQSGSSESTAVILTAVGWVRVTIFVCVHCCASVTVSIYSPAGNPEKIVFPRKLKHTGLNWVFVLVKQAVYGEVPPFTVAIVIDPSAPLLHVGSVEMVVNSSGAGSVRASDIVVNGH